MLPLLQVWAVNGVLLGPYICSALPWSAVIISMYPCFRQASFITPIAASTEKEEDIISVRIWRILNSFIYSSSPAGTYLSKVHNGNNRTREQRIEYLNV